jgi:SAM-dependent methyltransferase
MRREGTSWVDRRFRPLQWDLKSLAERSAAIRGKGVISARAEKAVYPIRALRYWWLACALRDEVAQREHATVADFGSSNGHFKRFFGDAPGIDWVAFDRQLDARTLRAAGYSACVECDFSAELPWRSNSIDVGIFSHVVEHLPDPETTIREIARVMRPGGLLLAGSPVVPRPFSMVRDWQHRRLYRQGRYRDNGHVNAMDTARWKRMLRNVGMEVEMMHGTFFFRRSGNPLENYRSWIRMNQLWGCLAPSYGGEIYLAARKRN